MDRRELQESLHRMTGAPGYWLNETSGILAPVVRAYLDGQDLDAGSLAIMRGYLRQWISAPGFIGADIAHLRLTVDGVRSMEALRGWLELADAVGVDPL